MSSNENNNVHHSAPISIDTHRRDRSGSVSDAASSASSDSIPSPSSISNSYSAGQPKVVSPSTSPILSYFLSQSPKAPTATFPFRRNFGAPVFEDEDTETEPTTHHTRRASTAWAGADRVPPPVPVPCPQQERAAGLLRRLSLGGSLGRPPVPMPKSAVGAAAPARPGRAATPPNPSAAETTPRRARRANTLNPGSRPKRAPSPMGERMLSGHFDGFN